MPVNMLVSAADKQQTAGDLLLFRLCAVIHGQCRTRQTKDHEDELTGEIAGRIRTEMHGVRIGQLSKEDVLTALDQLSADFHRTATAVCQNGR